MFHIRLCLFVCVNLFLCAKCSIPVERLCANPACNELISKAKGSVKYSPHTREVLGFNPGQEIFIISKSNNANDYWGAIINGKSGYVPSHLIKEVEIFHKTENLIAVPVELPQATPPLGSANPLQNNTVDEITTKPHESQKSSLPQLSKSAVEIQNNVDNTIKKNIKPDETFKVIEGTTIYADETDEITPSAAADVKSTPQNAASNNEKVNKGNSQERATIPPEVIEQNGKYQGNTNNITIESINENDENTKIESKDVDEEDEEDEEGDDDEEDNEDDEEEEDFGGEVNENLNTINQEKIKDSGSEKQSKPNEEEKMIRSSSQSMYSGVESKLPETVVVENSVTSQVSASVGDTNTQPPPVTLPPSPPQEVNKIETPSNGAPNSWTMLNRGPEGGLNAVPQQPVRNPEMKYAVPQPILSGFEPEAVPPVKTQSGSETAAVNSEVDVSAGKTQSGSETAAVNREVDASAATVEVISGFQSVTEASAAASEVLAGTDPTAQPVPQKEVEISASTQASEFLTSNDPTGQPVPQMEVDISASTPLSINQVPDTVTEESYATTPRSIAPETSTMFNQFSVSADSLPENLKNTEQPEMVEKMEVTTEVPATMPQQQIVTETPEQFSEPSQYPKVSDLPPKRVEEEATFSVTSETHEESLPKVTEDVKISEESISEAGEEPGVFSQITKIFSGWFSSLPKEEVPVESTFQAEVQINEAPSGSCQSPEFGSDCKDFISQEEQTSSWFSSGFELDSILTNSNTFLYLVVTAVTVLLFTLGHNLIEKRGKTAPLIAKINKLEQELLVSLKECSLLKDEIQNTKEKIILYENSAKDELVVSLQAELEESKKIRSELESSIEVLQQELDAATDAGFDLNKMLSEIMVQKCSSESLLKSIESLQAQLDSQQKVIDEMTEKLGVKNQENEALQSELEVANEKSENLEEQLSDIKHNLNIHLKEKEDLTRDLNSQISQLKTRINQIEEAKGKEITKLKKDLEETSKKLSETSGALTVKEEEVKALKESMKHLKTKGDVKMETVFDVSRVQAELAKEVKENRALLEKVEKEESGKKALVEQVKAMDDEMQKLRKRFEEAEQRKDEAEKKLEVLSTYFKEKETQLQKELGLQEALWAQKKGDEKAVYNMMKSLQEEVESYKSQNETLKQEIIDQERGLKSQMATFEQKAYENWVAARQAERKLEETKQEMAQLRNRLTLVEKNSNNVDGKGIIRSEELNGVEAASPILHDTSSPLLFPPLPLDPNNSNLLPPGFMHPPMFMPPPIGGFIPPPPFLPGDRRPPPLGRMSSPPLNNRFSPSSPPDYPFERMPSPPLSPNYRYKD